MKVAMIVTDLSVANGVASCVMNYFNRLDHSSIHVDFIQLMNVPSPYITEVESAGGKVITLPPISGITKYIQTCRKIILDGKYDVIHNNSLNRTIPLMIVAKMAHVPVRILHSHNSKLGETLPKRLINKLLFPLLKMQSTSFFACSTMVGNAMFGAHLFTVIPNAINVDKFSKRSEIRAKIRRELNISVEHVVGSVGRLALQKNPFFALDVFSELLHIIPDAIYWWVGTGPLYDKLWNYAKEIGISEKMQFWGNRNDVNELYQGMDVFFMPSFFEGLPVTAIEAQMAELPCLLSDNVTNEVVYSNLVHFASLSDDAVTWAKKLADIMETSNENVKYYDKNRFDIDKCKDCLLTVYRGQK